MKFRRNIFDRIILNWTSYKIPFKFQRNFISSNYIHDRNRNIYFKIEDVT